MLPPTEMLMGDGLVLRRYRAADGPDLLEAVRESVAQVAPYETWCHEGYTPEEAAPLHGLSRGGGLHASGGGYACGAHLAPGGVLLLETPDEGTLLRRIICRLGELGIPGLDLQMCGSKLIK